MQGNITWEVVFLLVAVASGVLGIWWRIERRIEKAEAESAKQYEQCHARISAAANSLSEYKLKATEQFASHEHLKEVEVRLTGAIDRLTNRIEQLPTRFAEEVAKMVKPGRRG